MAQRTEKEETELKVPETITLCVNNCGFTGNPTTNNMCQKCFNAATATSSNTGISAPRKLSGEKSSRSRSRSPVLMDSVRDSSRNMSVDRLKSEEPAKRLVNRCSGCRKRVGLTGFRCRCGELFCAEHRYSDRHDCSFDYKAAGRDAIARENPVVKAPKIIVDSKENLKNYTEMKIRNPAASLSLGDYRSVQRERGIRRRIS